MSSSLEKQSSSSDLQSEKFDLNQQFHQFIYRMESEVGRTGQTLHQIATEYLQLKSVHLDLALQLQLLELPEVTQLTPEALARQTRLLTQLQEMKQKMIREFGTLAAHPWQGFAHGDHLPPLPTTPLGGRASSEECETLVRTIRLLSVQLMKFWVDVQSFPLFLNHSDSLAVGEIENIFLWLTASPEWHEQIPQPRVIAALLQPESRRVLLGFMRNVKSIRVLCEKARKFQCLQALTEFHLRSSYAELTQGLAIIERDRIQLSHRVGLELMIEKNQQALEWLQEVHAFFAQVSAQTGAPMINRFEDLAQITAALAWIQQLPQALLQWRQAPQVFLPQQQLRIQVIRDRAKPMLEARTRITAHFIANDQQDPEELRQLAVMMTSGGIFRTLQNPYLAAMARYRELLRENLGPRAKIKETPLEISERLHEWANFIDQSKAFEKNQEFSKIFGPLFQGIDTDFESAEQVFEWSQQMQQAFASPVTDYTAALVRFLNEASEVQLKAWSSVLLSSLGLEKRAVFAQTPGSFADLGLLLQEKWQRSQTLLEILNRLGIHPDVSLQGGLQELAQLHEEITFLLTQLDPQAAVVAILQGGYQGFETDLAIIENGLGYLDFIELSPISDRLKARLLSQHAPQQLVETRGLIQKNQQAFAALKESLQKLEAVSYGQSAWIRSTTIPQVLTMCQQALKVPSQLEEWIEYLQLERQARGEGLGALLACQALPAEVDPAVVFRLVFLGSLLRKVIAEGLLGGGENALPSLVFH